MFEQTFKNIDDVLWKEAGCSSELDYTEQTSWLLFLKYLDDLEQDKSTEAALDGKKYQERVLAGEVTPQSPCPDEGFLRDLARKSKRIALSDPGVDHAASCPRCMSRLLILRQANHSHRRKLVLTFAAASCLVILVALIALARYGVHKESPPANMAVVSQTVNPWNAGTFRGAQPGSLQSVSLPAALVRLTIILPRFSAPGQRRRPPHHTFAESRSWTERSDSANDARCWSRGQCRAFDGSGALCQSSGRYRQAAADRRPRISIEDFDDSCQPD